MGGSFSNSGQIEASGSGTITALNEVVAVPVPATASLTFAVSGTWVATLTFEGSVDGTTFFAIPAVSFPTLATTTTTTANANFGVSIGGFYHFRVRASLFTSGTATITWNTDSTAGVMLAPRTVVGGTDGSVIGNTGDRLRVDSTATYPGSKYRILDMNVANGGVARGTAITSTVTYTTIFNYTGSGQLFNFLVTFEGNLVGADPFNVRVIIDGVTLFELNTDDVGTDQIYDLTNAQDESGMGLSLNTNVLRFTSPRSGGLYYASNIQIAIKKAAGGSKLFRAGMVTMTKDT